MIIYDVFVYEYLTDYFEQNQMNIDHIYMVFLLLFLIILIRINHGLTCMNSFMNI